MKRPKPSEAVYLCEKNGLCPECGHKMPSHKQDMWFFPQLSTDIPQLVNIEIFNCCHRHFIQRGNHQVIPVRGHVYTVRISTIPKKKTFSPKAKRTRDLINQIASTPAAGIVPKEESSTRNTIRLANGKSLCKNCTKMTASKRCTVHETRVDPNKNTCPEFVRTDVKVYSGGLCTPK